MPNALKKYTADQLSIFFGVSVATISNWLRDGRIIGVLEAGEDKPFQIPETAIYKSGSGQDIPISEIVILYEEERRRTSLRSTTPIQENKEILGAIAFFEDKYGGGYEKTLGARDRELSALEKRDAEQWEYYSSIAEQLS